MKFDGEFGQWLGDRERHRRSLATADALALRWSESEAHRAATARFAALAGAGAGHFVAATKQLFEDEAWVDELIGLLVEPMLEDPFLEPPFRHLNSDIHSGFVVFEDESVSIAVGVTDISKLAAKKSKRRGRTFVGFSGQVDVIRFLKAGGARLAFWEAPRIAGDFTSQAPGRSRPAGTADISDGETVVIDGRYRSFAIEHATSNLLLLQATIKVDQAALSVEYDSETGEYVGCSAAEDSASRIQMISTLLRKLDCTRAFPAIAAFLESESFFVRWHVMRELLGLDAAAALPHLERMARADPHPENRKAAAAVLARLRPMAAELRKAS